MGTETNSSKITVTNKYPDPEGGQYAYQANAVTIPSGVYVSGTHTVSWTARVHFTARPNVAQKIQVYLAESSTPGNNDILIHEETFTTLATGYYTFNVTNKSFSGSSTNLTNKSLGLRFSKATGGLTPSNAVIELEIAKSALKVNTVSAAHTVTTSVDSSGGGTLSANKASAAEGETVTLSPIPDTGYQLKKYTVSPSSVAINNNKFTMPAQNVSVKAYFELRNYTITQIISPAGAGTITTRVNNQSAASAKMGDTVTLTQTPASGYAAYGYTTNPSVTITNSSFTMPAKNIAVTGQFRKISTATLSSTTLTGGSTVNMTITQGASGYTHKYRLNFGTGMDTGLVSVSSGVTSVNISVPLNWSEEIQNATTKTGSLTLESYNSGGTKIGEQVISNLTYKVPASVVPVIGTITTTIARTIGGTTYANIGDYYTQSHSGVQIQVSATGAQRATITSTSVAISGYSGTGYNYTTASGSVNFTSGLLTIAGNTTITVTATDSRGRTATATATISVQAYTNPSGMLNAWRADLAGDASDTGGYGKYQLSKQFTQLGSNTLTFSLALKYNGTTLGTENSPADGPANLLPSDRKTIETTKEYTVQLTLADSFETTVITARIPSAKFIIFAESGGDRLAFMGVPANSIPTGKTSTVEFSADSQIYIGSSTLENYILAQLPAPPAPPTIPELHSKNVSGNTNTNGNIALGSTIPNECVLTIDISGTYLAIPFYSNSQWYARVLNRSTMAVATETSVSMTVYYMY